MQHCVGFFNLSLLPWRMGVAEEGAVDELAGELVVQGELGAVVEGHGAAQHSGRLPELGAELGTHGGRGLVGDTRQADGSGAALAGDEDELAGS